MRWDIIFYCVVSLLSPALPLIGEHAQIGALVAAVWLSFLPD
jgi:hypothetical protein